MLINELADKGFTPFHHHHEVELMFIHVLDIGLAEISSIDDKTDVLVPIADGLVNHEPKLTNVVDRPRIELIKEWNAIVLIHG